MSLECFVRSHLKWRPCSSPSHPSQSRNTHFPSVHFGSAHLLYRNITSSKILCRWCNAALSLRRSRLSFPRRKTLPQSTMKSNFGVHSNTSTRRVVTHVLYVYTSSYAANTHCELHEIVAHTEQRISGALVAVVTPTKRRAHRLHSTGWNKNRRYLCRTLQYTFRWQYRYKSFARV